MKILAIETSCDETSAAVVENGRNVLSNVVASQIPVHRKYYGVVPELASRAHIESINAVTSAAVKRAGMSMRTLSPAIDAIAYTRGPGLAGSLLVGQICAQTLAYLAALPIVDVNHLEGHLYAALLEHETLMPPFLSLIVSGGHTELVVVEKFGKYRILGGTRDDAAGEAFDKVAKLLKLSYPGGPVIDVLAGKGNARAIPFPRPYLWENWDFSFSGLKTAVVNYVMKQHRPPAKRAIEDICASFQQAVVETLAEKTFAAANKFRMTTIVVGGGVAANSQLRSVFAARGKKEGVKMHLPSLSYCTDNAAMVAAAACFKYRALGRQGCKDTAGGAHRIEPSLRLESWNA